MAEHGEYRSLYTSLSNDDEFIATSPVAKAVFYTLKLELPSIGIGVLSIVPLAATVNDTRHAVEAAIIELAPKWVRRDRSVFWIVNGLRFHPNLSPSNPKHRRHVLNALNNLPRSVLVEEFRAMYAMWLPVPTAPQGEGTDTDPIPFPITTNEDEDDHKDQLRTTSSSSADAMTPDEIGAYCRALITAANRGMKANPKIGDAMNPIIHGHAKSLTAAETILAAGVPREFAQSAIVEIASTYKPSPRSRQISSLAFCTDRVIEQWEKSQAAPGGAATPSARGKRGGYTPVKHEYTPTEAPVVWGK